MELPWQTNWTEKMKTNATANRVLNTPIGESTFFCPPDLDTPKFELTFGQFDKMQNVEDDEKSELREIPIFKNVEKVRMSSDAFTTSADEFNKMITKDQVDATTDPNDVILLDIKNVPYVGKQESDSYSIMNNMYIKDYLNVHHPSIRQDWTGALKSGPLQIKPPPFFFSQ